MADLTPAQLAEQAHDAMAELCRATIWDGDPRGYQWPADVDAVASSLRETAHAMSQASQQAARWLTRQQGQIGHDAGGDLLDLPEAIAALWAAAEQARILGEAFDAAAQRTTHLTGIKPGEVQP